MDSSEKAVLSTLLYSSLFHFPLTEKEIWQYLHSEHRPTKQSITTVLSRLCSQGVIVRESGYYCIKGEEHTLKERKADAVYLRSKVATGKRVAFFLSYIPTILFIGLSGSIAAGQAAKSADIDFFIITKNDTVWITRFITFALLSCMHLRRTKEMDTAPGRICLNYFIDETALSYSSVDHDIYTAREIAQLKPLYNKAHTYELFLAKNNWVKEYLPNTIFPFSRIPAPKKSSPKKSILIPKIERIVFHFQQYYMTGKRLSDSDKTHRVTFYNPQFKQRIIGQFEARLKDYSLLTK